LIPADSGQRRWSRAAEFNAALSDAAFGESGSILP
jgi:hypothetical protein